MLEVLVVPETAWSLNSGIYTLHGTLVIGVLSDNGFSSDISLFVEVEGKYSLSSFRSSIVALVRMEPISPVPPEPVIKLENYQWSKIFFPVWFRRILIWCPGRAMVNSQFFFFIHFKQMFYHLLEAFWINLQIESWAHGICLSSTVILTNWTRYAICLTQRKQKSSQEMSTAKQSRSSFFKGKPEKAWHTIHSKAEGVGVLSKPIFFGYISI